MVVVFVTDVDGRYTQGLSGSIQHGLRSMYIDHRRR